MYQGILRITAALLLLGAALAKAPKRPALQGTVVFSDGSAPQQLVAIERVCNGVVEFAGYADSDGAFRIDVAEGAAADCHLQAYLPGYRSQKDGDTLTLKPLGKQAANAKSARDKDPTKPAQRLFVKALDAAAKTNWKAAEDQLERATTVFHGFPSAWLNLGVLQERKGDLAAAKKSYKEAAASDDGFALAHLQAASVEIARQDWLEALTESDKVIALDPQAFPRAYLLNAQANLNLHKLDDAEKRAQEGLKLDGEQRFPELHYVLALVLTDKADRAGAIEQLQAYLALKPQGPSAAAARESLKKLSDAK